MKYIKTFENIRNMTLYHGTSLNSATSLVNNGWQPYSGFIGGNNGQNKYLYLTNDPENARWFANEKGDDTIVEVSNIPLEYLRPDPEDEAGFTMKQLLNRIDETGFPASFVLYKELNSDHFKII